MSASGLHAGQPVLRAGPPPGEASAAAILVHGRGASARDILTLADEIRASDLSYVAPQAAGGTWYPLSFLAPVEQNEPGLSSGLAVLAGMLDELTLAGIPPERVLLLGFSQGACLTLEFAARHARRFGAIAGLTGGLIGPAGNAARVRRRSRRDSGVPGCGGSRPPCSVDTGGGDGDGAGAAEDRGDVAALPGDGARGQPRRA